MTWGNIYLAVLDQHGKWKDHLVLKLKNRNGTLNRKEIRFIFDVYHIQTNPRPDNSVRARIIKTLNGEDMTVKRPGNPGTARNRARDIALTEAFASWCGDRGAFVAEYATREGHYLYGKKSGRETDLRTIDRALLRGAQYIRQDTDKLEQSSKELQERINGLDGYLKLLEIIKAM